MKQSEYKLTLSLFQHWNPGEILKEILLQCHLYQNDAESYPFMELSWEGHQLVVPVSRHSTALLKQTDTQIYTCSVERLRLWSGSKMACHPEKDCPVPLVASPCLLLISVCFATEKPLLPRMVASTAEKGEDAPE